MGQFVDGKKEGVWEVWRGGQILERKQYKNDCLGGESFLWEEDGTLSSLTTYKKGKKHGKYTSWHRNGLEAEIGQYVEGERSGHWIFRDIRGNLV